MNLAQGGGENLLEQLLYCGKQVQGDHRFGAPGAKAASELRARVSLLRGFVDISGEPGNWELGQHGLWYCPSSELAEAGCVYLPEIAERIAGIEDPRGDGDEEPDASSSGVDRQRVLRALRVRGLRRADVPDAEDVDALLEKEELPQGHCLYRFDVLDGESSVGNLPTMKTRLEGWHHGNLRELILAQAKIRMEEESGAPAAAIPGGSRFAVLTAGDAARVRAFVVPTTGAYSNAHVRFMAKMERASFNGLDEVRRIFVLAPVWDCYVDGLALPERRCAWYATSPRTSRVPLDLAVLEQLRRFEVFSEVSVEQDMKERSIEALLPIVTKCLPDGQDYTLVPLLVGGVVPSKAEEYVSVLEPFLSDPANLFVVAGDVDELGGDSMQDAAPNSSAASSGEGADTDASATTSSDQPAARWMREVPSLIGQQGQFTFDSLELFLAVLTQVPQEEKLRLVHMR